MTKSLTPANPGLKRSWLITVLVAAAPFALYAMSRYLGFLPSEQAWIASGENHGPWRSAWQSVFLILPFALVPISIVRLIQTLTAKNWPSAKRIALLLVFQLVIMWIPLLTLFWTID
ncbi:MAG: hypothetical protein EOP05_22425 [Proteobacteria bacterium]|nr:MAG: hypothetical protein EOP05_22425 [Pseudomonadota bacterium]